jgi:hypothetical protein
MPGAPQSIPAAALTPLRHRLTRLRAEILDAQSAAERVRYERAALELEQLIRKLETGHGPITA